MSKQAPSFEKALEELESIVRSMEEDALDLEQLVERFERGTKLQRHCQSILEKVEERIEILKNSEVESEYDAELEDEEFVKDDESDDDELLF